MGTVFIKLFIYLFPTGVAVFKNEQPLGFIEATRGPHCPSFSRTPSSTGFPPPPPPPSPSPPSLPPPPLSSSSSSPPLSHSRCCRSVCSAGEAALSLSGFVRPFVSHLCRGRCRWSSPRVTWNNLRSVPFPDPPPSIRI